MTNAHSMQVMLERALAFAHAALDETTPHLVAESKRYAALVLPQLGRMKPTALTLGDGRRMIELVSQLRAVLEVLDRKLEHRLQPARN
jgi:hypothetical protein